ncbi:MAG: extracellular solute-binding protein, partial [Treponema sp.]|nr:extracellular solute-binding protein [Treponema sp.]
MKKLMVFIFTAFAVSGLFAGGAQQPAGSSSQPGVVTLTQFVNWTGVPDRYMSNIDGRIQKIVEQKTGVRVNTTFATAPEEATLMIASGNIPDLITVWYESAEYYTLAPSKMVIDFMPYVKKDHMDFYNYMGDGFWNFYKSPNGVNNYFPNWAFYPNSGKKYAAVGVWNQVLLQRTDIFKALGSPDLSTPDKFMAHLLDVKAKYPNIKPYLSRPSSSLMFTNNAGSGLDMFKMMFGIEGYYTAPDGTIKGAYQNPRYVDLMVFLNQMYRNGLLTRDDLANTDENFSANYDKGGFYMTVMDAGAARYPPTAAPDLPYQASQVWDTTTGTQQNAIAGLATFVSSKCKYPDKAIDLIAYLAQEEGD